MKKPLGLTDYLAPWFIPLFMFFAGFFLSQVVQIKVEISSDRQVSSNR